MNSLPYRSVPTLRNTITTKMEHHQQGGASQAPRHEAYCDRCSVVDGQQTFITGVRYKCSVCQDFDLCEICLLTNEQRGGHIHDPTHLFLRVARPLPREAFVNILPSLPTPLPIRLPTHSYQLAQLPTSPVAPFFGDALLPILNAASTNSQNIFFSPYSIELCCLLAANGCTPNSLTQREFLSTLRITSSNSSSLDAHNLETSALLTSLAKSSTVAIANSVWTRRIPFDQNYTDAVMKVLGAVAHQSENVADVNAWVNSATRGKISGILNPALEMPWAVLVNAVYFKDDWLEPFPQHRTRKQQFMRSSGVPKSVSMMQLESSFQYLAAKNFKAVVLPYKGPLCAVFVLPAYSYPTDSLPEFDDVFAQLVLQPASRGRVSMPKFKAESSYDLKKPLQSMGLAAAFNQGHQEASRDFDVMLTQKGAPNDFLYVTDILHRAFVEVDEMGTEAAAVTAIAMFGSCAMSVPQTLFEFTCDRPFRFYICTKQAGRPPGYSSMPAGKVVFMGEIRDPTEAP